MADQEQDRPDAPERVADPDDPMEGRRFQPTGGQVPSGDAPTRDLTEDLDRAVADVGDDGPGDEDRPAVPD